MTGSRRPAGRIAAALRLRDFRLLWLAQLGSSSAWQLQMLAFGYLAYHLTGSVVALGTVTVVAGLPSALLSPLGGAVADRFGKRATLRWSQLTLALLAAATVGLLLAGQLSFTVLCLLAGVRGVLLAVTAPVRQAYLPQLVPDGELVPAAVALTSASSGLTRMVLPAMAGGLIALPRAGLPVVFGVVTASYGWVVAMLWRIRDPGLARGESRRTPGALAQDLARGFGYVARTPPVLAVLGLSLVTAAVGFPYFYLLPAIAVADLHLGAPGLGLLYATDACGGVAGTLSLATLGQRRRLRASLLGSSLAFGAALVGFGLALRAGSLPAALATLVVVGGTGDVFLAVARSLLLLESHPDQTGRVMGVAMAAQALEPVALLPLAALAAAVSVPVVLVAGGVVVVATTGAGGLGSRRWARGPR